MNFHRLNNTKDTTQKDSHIGLSLQKILTAGIFHLLLFLPFWSISQNTDQLIGDLKTLSSDEMQGRKPGTIGHQLAMQYIVDRFESLELITDEDSYIQLFEISNNRTQLTGKNVIGKIAGKSDKIIVISAHYDHLGVRSGKVYSGADDNASGVAALLYLAEYFVQNTPNHTLVFAAFDIEESGLQGSKYFAETMKKGKVVLNVNMDMISRSDKKEIYACGTRHSPNLRPLLETVNIKHPMVNLKLGHDDSRSKHDDWTYLSDQAWFHKNNIPFIYFGVEDHSDYHKHTDTFDKIDTAFYTQVVELIQDFTIEFDTQTEKK